MTGTSERFSYGILDFSSRTSSAFGSRHYLGKVFPRLSFIEIFLDRVMRIKGIQRYMAVVHSSIINEIKPYLAKYPAIQIGLIPDGEGIPFHYMAHGRIISGRKWSHQSIRGGLFDSTIYDEHIPMELIKQISAQIPVSEMVWLHPECPLLIPEYVEQAIGVARSKPGITGGLPLVIRQSMLGLCPAVITQFGIVDLKKRNWMPLHVFRCNRLHDGMVSMRQYMQHNMEEDVERGRFLLRSQRDASRLRRLLIKLGEKELDWTITSFSKVLKECPEVLLEDSPRELDLDVTASPYPEQCRMPRLAPMPDMEPELLEKIYSQACEEEDLLLTIGEYGNLMEYNHLSRLRELISARKPFGLQLVFDAESILRNQQAFLPFFELPVDIISIRLTSLCYSKEFTLEGFEPLLEEIAKKQLSREDVPQIHLQLHKFEDIWRRYHTVIDWSLKHNVDCNWVPYNDHSCQMPPHRETIAYVPLRRYPCEKLLYQMYVFPDGSTSLCKTDFKGSFRMGSLREKSLRELWNGPERLEYRRRHILGFYEPELCKSCRNWMHT